MATAPNNVYVILIRGLLGLFFSRGMDTLAAKLQARGYRVEVWNHGFFVWPLWFMNKWALRDECVEAYRDGKTIVLVGHSFGGTCCLMLARLLAGLGVPVRALFAVDPAAQYDCSVPANVTKAWGFRNNVGGLGRGRLTGGAATRIVDLPVADNHGYIDDDPAVHKRIIAEIEAV